ncbi:hypothetical protein [Rhizobacter fulvus]
MRFRSLFTLAAVLFASGCASIVNGVNQPVSVVAKAADNTDVVGARCTLTNSKGEWYTTTPGSVVVHRAYGNMGVNCVHPTSAGVASVKSTTKAMAFGNIIFGGLIGVGIDVGTGSAYDYPDLISVSMMSSIGGVTQSPQVSVVQATTAAPVPAPPPPAPVAVAVAPPIAAPSPPSPASPASVQGLKGGQDGFNAERLAKSQSCSAIPRAVLTGKGPGFETYSVACESGDALSMRCEFGNCRVLK